MSEHEHQPQSTQRISTRRVSVFLIVAVAGAAVTIGACAFDGTKKAKEVLTQFGTIDAEWEIRDDAESKTYTYVMLRTKADTHETFEIIAQDGRTQTEREMVGGIDGTGCYLTSYGVSTRWIDGLPTEALEDTRKSGDKIRTACLEYKDTPGWQFVPAEDKKAAEPPPPPPKEPAPDAGTAPDSAMDESDEEESGGEEESGDEDETSVEEDVESTMEGTLPL